MQRRRFYAPPENIAGRVIKLDRDESHHLSRVLRLDKGAEVFVLDGAGKEYACRVARIAGIAVELEITEELTVETESPLKLILAQALAKSEKFDLIVQKAAELGIHQIIPLAADHADMKLDHGRASERQARWRRISLEALKQCGRTRLVEIRMPVDVDSLLESNATGNVLVAFTEHGGLALNKAMANIVLPTEVTLMIGPEGGWSERELTLFDQHRVVCATLGPRVLRTETAAIAAVALAQNILGDLSRPRS